MIFRTFYLSIIIIVCGVFITKSYAQQDFSLEDLIEDIASSTDAELDYTSLYEDLNYFLTNPINLNTAKKADLEKLQFLNDGQIKSHLD